MLAVAAVLILPVKAFIAAKARMAPALSPAQRAELSRWTAQRVLDAAGTMERCVVCDDDEVATWAAARRATVLWLPGLGLNGAINAAVTEMTRRGASTALIAHGDLPLAERLSELGTPDRFTIVADRFDDGTNVLVMPTSHPIGASYGVGSFTRHLFAALSTGLPVTVRHDRRLSLDLDRPSDLDHPLIASSDLPSSVVRRDLAGGTC